VNEVMNVRGHCGFCTVLKMLSSSARDMDSEIFAFPNAVEMWLFRLSPRGWGIFGLLVTFVRLSREKYVGVSKSFRTGPLERKLQMVQLSATRCSYIAIL
jgi:hypothetical protein